MGLDRVHQPRQASVVVGAASTRLWWCVCCACAVLAALLRVASSPPSADAQTPHCVLDRMRRRVCLPERVNRVSCDDILCFESLLTLGEEHLVVQSRSTDAPWMALATASMHLSHFEEPSLEQMLFERVDVAFVYPKQYAFERYQRAGIAAFVAQSTAREAITSERFLADQRASLRLYAEVVGGDAYRRAQAWVDYLDTQVQAITQRVAHLAPGQRKSVYYVRGPDPLRTHGRRSCSFWYTYFAGGNMVTGSLRSDARSDVSAEQLIAWDPEVIFVGRQYSVESIALDPRFRSLRAVRNRQLFPVPSGIFYWDGGPESVLLMLWAAKRLHPAQFMDLDLAAEVRRYYAEFYSIPLGDQTLSNLLAGRDHLGLRRARVRN